MVEVSLPLIALQHFRLVKPRLDRELVGQAGKERAHVTGQHTTCVKAASDSIAFKLYMTLFYPIRLVTANQFDALEESTVPEIQRSNLCSVVLTMLSIGINDILAFDFMDSPGREDMKSALRQLRLLGAVTPEDQLTLRGRRMATFPIEPRLTAAILAASELGCTEEVVTIVALLSTESPLNLPAAKERREEAEAAHRKFAANEGDLVTLLAIWKAYKAGSGSQAWCREHFLVGRHLTFAAEIRKQLVGLCRNAEIAMESSRDLDNVRKALAHGLFMNVAQLTTEGHWVALDSGQKCHIHPQSVLFRTKPEVVVYTEMVHTSKTYLKVSCNI